MKKMLTSFIAIILFISLVGCGTVSRNPMNPSESPAIGNVITDDTPVLERTSQAFMPPRIDNDLDGLSTIIMPGSTNILYRWNVVNNSDKYTLIKRFTATIRIYSDSTAGDLGGFTLLRNGEDISRRTFIGKTMPPRSDGSPYDVLSLAVKGTNDIEPGPINYVVMEFAPPEAGTGPWAGGIEIIPPDSVVEYQLRAEGGTGFTRGDMIMTYLETDPWVKSDHNKSFLGDACSVAGKAVVTLQSKRGVKEDFRDTCFIYRMASRKDYGMFVGFDDLGGKPFPYQSSKWNNGFGVGSEPVHYPMELRL